MPFIFWIGVGGIVLTILLAIAGSWGAAIGTFVVTGLACGLYEKLDDWGLIPEPNPPSAPKPRTSATDEMIKSMKADAERRVAELPPPVLPEPRTDPVQGTMRVDVTQTARTVDVFIVLSDKAKQTIEANGIGDWPVEENFEGLKEYMEEFTERYDLDTKYNTIQDPWADRDPMTSDGHLQKAISRNITQTANDMRTTERKETRRKALKHEEQSYKDSHTVRVKDYLAYPYRKAVVGKIDADLYIKRLESEYLPRIKTFVDTGSRETRPKLSYDL
jgi:hypothetical protein